MANDYGRAAGLGLVCGLRTMLGPALVAQKASKAVRLVFGALSVGELIGDKLPKTPSRIAPGPLTGRLISGAAVGYTVCRAGGQSSPWAGAICGALGALAGAYGGYYGRRMLGEKLSVPDPVIAVLEDTLAVGLGRRLTQ